MKKLWIWTALVVTLAFTAGNVSAQDSRLEWSARVRTDLQLNFNPVDEDGENVPGIGFYDDDDGGAYSWETMGELLLWYGRDRVSMWGILSYRQGWGFETIYNLSFDNDRSGNVGGKIQIGSSFSGGGTDGRGFSLFSLDRISLYTWYQAWNRRILMELNPFGAEDEEWGPIWKTPAWLFDDRDIVENTGLPGEGAAFFDGNYDALFRIQFRNVIDNLNFGLTLPHFGRLTNLQWAYNHKIVDGMPQYWEAQDLFLSASLGFRYSVYEYTIAGGFKLDPDKAQRFYIGGEYRLTSQIFLRGDFKLLNIGGIGDDIGDLDMAQGVVFQDGPWHLMLSLYERNLLWQDNSELELGIRAQIRYTIIPRRLLSRLRLYYDHGLGDATQRQQFEIEPGIFWAIGTQGVSDDLDNYSGMMLRFNYTFGKSNDGATIDQPKMYIGFRWSM